MTKVFANVDDMLVGMARDCIKHGVESGPRGRLTRELYGWSGRLVDPRRRRCYSQARHADYTFAAASVAWNLACRNDVESICWWNEFGRKMSDDGETFYGANYGQRFMPYLYEAIALMGDDIDTRRAWVPIWQPTDLVDPEGRGMYSRKGLDVPCTLGFGLKRRNGFLDMHVQMRSQSVIGPFVYDLYLFAVIHELLANTLMLSLGQLHWHCLSLHVYDSELERATHVVKEWEDTLYTGEHAKYGPTDVTIDKTLHQAREDWPQLFSSIVEGGAIGTYEDTKFFDPVELLMLQGMASRIQDRAQ